MLAELRYFWLNVLLHTTNSLKENAASHTKTWKSPSNVCWCERTSVSSVLMTVSRSSFKVKLMWNSSKLSVVCRNVPPDSAVGASGDYLCVEGETLWLIDVFQRNRGGNIRRPQDVSEDAFTVRTWSIKYKMWAEFWEDESRGDGHEEIKSREAQLESGV